MPNNLFDMAGWEAAVQRRQSEDRRAALRKRFVELRGGLPWRYEPHRADPTRAHIVNCRGENVITNLSADMAEFIVKMSEQEDASQNAK